MLKINQLKFNKTYLGIELGSTRIKAVLIGKNHEPLASGSFDWENSYDNGVWTYPLEQVWEGLQGAFAKLKANILEKYGVKLTSVGALGISGMMHGYLAFDKDGNLLSVNIPAKKLTVTVESYN